MILGFEEPVQAKYVRFIGTHTTSDQGNDKHMAVSELRARVATEARRHQKSIPSQQM